MVDENNISGSGDAPYDLSERTLQFGLRVIRLSRTLRRTEVGRVLGNQLLRSGTSIGANYRSAQRGRSRREFIAKLSVAVEEADETQYWLELLERSDEIEPKRLAPLAAEARELTAVLTASQTKARRRPS